MGDVGDHRRLRRPRPRPPPLPRAPTLEVQPLLVVRAGGALRPGVLQVLGRLGRQRLLGLEDGQRELHERLVVVLDQLVLGPEHTPTQAEPHIRLIVDRIEELRGDPLASLLKRLVVTGRKAAVDIVLTASTTHLDAWPEGLRRHIDRHGNTEILPDRRPADED
ncbi:hypothetical protein ACFVFS_34540 [Kitasatospora sp. NPDC057692]|uniref:hypothetical protein n=1 Tax=Kitasatospora sp. NPDC057692 TaxID=3346215 RepID=UPI0036BFF73A